MKMKIFTVYDEKSRAYMQPFFFHQAGEATRAFQTSINKLDHPFGMHPSDYTLYIIGEYDDENGLFETYAPQTLGNGVEFIDPELTNLEEQVHALSNAESIRPDTEGGNSS